MEITKNLLRVRNQGKGGSRRLSISIEKGLSTWLREKNLSPTAIFKEACRELGYGKEEVEE